MKCAVSDFDRTLYVDGEVSRRNLEAVKAWQQAGHWFVLATGRNEASIRVQLETYGLHPDALILNNGAVILDGRGKRLFCKTIEPRAVREILLFLHHYNDDGSGVSMLSKKVNVLSKRLTTTQKPCDGDLTIEELDEITDVVQIHRRRLEDPEGIRRLCDILNQRFPSISAYANVWNADIVAEGVDKGAAVSWLAQYTGAFKEIRTIGDSANDLGMIRRFGGAAPVHASPEALKAAKRVVQDVAEYLELETE